MTIDKAALSNASLECSATVLDVYTISACFPASSPDTSRHRYQCRSYYMPSISAVRSLHVPWRSAHVIIVIIF